MGYSIPGADFTTPAQLQTNVGAEGGRTVGAMLAQFGKQLQLANVQAKKTEALQGQMEDSIMITNGKITNAALAAGKEKFGSNNVLYDEWKAEVIKRGDQATQDQIDFRFGGLTGEAKAAKLASATGFDTWLDESQKNMGRLLTDVMGRAKTGTRVIGDPTNSEQQLNQVILTANGGESAVANFGEGATMTRSLSGDNKELVNTRVRIPVNSETLTTLNSKSGGTAISVYEKGVEEGIIKKNVGEDGIYYYEFEKQIDTSSYSRPGGVDFVIENEVAIDSGQTFQDLGYLDENMIIKPALFARTGEDELTEDGADVDAPKGEPASFTSSSTKGAAPGYTKTTTSKIIDIDQMYNNPALAVQVNAATDGILLSSRKTDAKIASFAAYGVVSLDDFPDMKKEHGSLRNFLQSGDKDKVKAFTKRTIQETMFKDLFNKTDNRGDRVYSQTELKDPKLLKYLNDNGIKNSVGQPYAMGETVYSKNEVKETKILDEKGLSFNQNLYKNLKAGGDNLAALFQTPVQMPGAGNSQVMFFPASGDGKGNNSAGVYRIATQGIDKGQKADGASNLSPNEDFTNLTFQFKNQK